MRAIRPFGITALVATLLIGVICQRLSGRLCHARGFTLYWLTTDLNLVATNLRRLKDFLNQQADETRKPPSPKGPDKRRRAKTAEDYSPDPNDPPVVGLAARAS